MGEETSLLMDGELDEGRLDSAYRGLKESQGRADWNCYHLIGDYLRHPDTARLPRVFAEGEFVSRVSAALTEEPTILAPRPQRVKPAFMAWAVAASAAAVGFVGWFALQPQGDDGASSLARIAADARNAQIRRASNVNDYVTVHRQYAPTMAMERARPFIRSVATPQDAAQ